MCVCVCVLDELEAHLAGLVLLSRAASCVPLLGLAVDQHLLNVPLSCTWLQKLFGLGMEFPGLAQILLSATLDLKFVDYLP